MAGPWTFRGAACFAISQDSLTSSKSLGSSARNVSGQALSIITEWTFVILAKLWLSLKESCRG